jgi:hypothetical protein
MRENRTSGTVPGAPGNRRPYGGGYEEKDWVKIFKQIVKEFWIPLLLSVAWVLYNIYGSESSEAWNIQKVVNTFGPTFFLLEKGTDLFIQSSSRCKSPNTPIKVRRLG